MIPVSGEIEDIDGERNVTLLLAIGGRATPMVLSARRGQTPENNISQFAGVLLLAESPNVQYTPRTHESLT